MLVVDDDQTILSSLCALLQPTGFEVAGACSADAAMALLDDGLDPDVILTDLSIEHAGAQWRGARGYGAVATTSPGNGDRGDVRV